MVGAPTLLSVDDTVDLVVNTFERGDIGDAFVRKPLAATRQSVS